MNYKAQIEAVLLNKDWEVMMIDLNKGCIENWKVQFKFNPNIYFYLYFPSLFFLKYYIFFP